MAVRITEAELAIPALRCAERAQNGEITTSDLISQMTAICQPDGEDTEILEGRTDTKFSQKVRNLVSHREGKGTMFAKGYAEYTGDGIRLTPAGQRFLDSLPL